jgi:methionine synthase I (cobalamin-dependent)
MQRFGEGRLLFDGGMGSMLIERGLEIGCPPEEWNASRPDVIKSVHRAYLEAGAEVVGTNTFGGTPSRLSSHGFGSSVGAFNASGLRLAREAIAETEPDGRRTTRRFVAFSMGPSSEMLPPVGLADESQVRAEFEGQLGAVGDDDPPDLILVETMIDLREALIALEVAKRMTRVPVAVSLTYNRNRRGFFTPMGNEAATAAGRLEAAGADVVAANCSISSGDMFHLAKLLRGSTSLPVLVQPNAGDPSVRDDMPVYDQTPAEFAGHVAAMFDAGIQAVGGCCGTTPEFIRQAADAAGFKEQKTRG